MGTVFLFVVFLDMRLILQLSQLW